MSVIVKEDLNDWITVYQSRVGALDMDDIKIISKQIAYDMDGLSWDYDLDDESTMLIVYKEY